MMANFWFDQLHEYVVPPSRLFLACSFDECRFIGRLDENRVDMASNLFGVGYLNHIRHINTGLWYRFGLMRVEFEKKWKEWRDLNNIKKKSISRNVSISFQLLRLLTLYSSTAADCIIEEFSSIRINLYSYIDFFCRCKVKVIISKLNFV